MERATEPRLLLLETSGRSGLVAVAQGEHLCAVRPLVEARRHARDLAPAVAELLAGQGWQPRDVHAVVIGRGPGSYTGLRVGLTSAKVFAYATGCTFLALDTFALLAAQAPLEAMCLDVLADAQQEKVYVQRFTRSSEDLLPRSVTPLRVQAFAEWLTEWQPPVWVTGPGMRPHLGKLPPGAQVVDAEQWDLRAESVLRLGLGRYRAGEGDDVWTAEPLYLRPSSAEENWEKKRQTNPE